MPVENRTAFALLAGGKNSREYAIELFNRKILADVAICAGMERGMHLFLVVTNAGKNNDWEGGIHFANEGDERDSIYFWHLKIDNGYLAVVFGEPGGGLEAIGQGTTGMAALSEIGNQELGDPWVVIDDEELGIFAFGRLHGYNFHNH